MTQPWKEGTATPLAGHRVVIVEDDRTMAMVAESICRKLGARTTVVCADGAAAAEALAAPGEATDIVLLDMMLGAGDGIAALRGLDATRLTAEIIPVSASDPRVLDAAVRLLAGRGFRVHSPIAKPLTADKLARALDAAPHHCTLGHAAEGQPSAERLAAAIAADEIVPWFQPQRCARTGRIISVEVLARWADADRGLLTPAWFIPGLEQSGLIAPMTERLLDQAASALARLGAAALPLGLSINISAPTLADPDLPERLEAIITAHGLAPRQVTFEITESAVLANPLLLLEGTARLRLHGFGLAIDDFGTGWSSLDQLRTLPFTELKIDRSFVSGAPADPARRVILASTVTMAHGLGLTVVAEGVETEAERTLLAALGVDLIQGWLSGRPTDADALAALLDAERASQRHSAPHTRPDGPSERT
ncbi:EAL domain-containing protein [Elioraea sp.]|uniref:EAL domain-containing response regulator n=1 Tax=Elioraea sp. TaxID=2185103 RepID=UPI0025BC3D3D|nr:EAL domain-containing response regulator [Elioraea sp.]